MHEIVFSKIPIPCSENQAYRNVPKVGRVATKALRDFKKQFKIWSLINSRAISEARIRMSVYERFDFHTLFCFEKTRVVCKDGKSKRIDLSNRIKCIHDAICDVLGIDDSSVWKMSAEKAAVPFEEEQAIIRIVPLPAPASDKTVPGSTRQRTPSVKNAAPRAGGLTS